MSRDRIKDVLFVAGPQWGQRSPEDIISALETAGYVIVPNELLIETRTALKISDYPSDWEIADKIDSYRSKGPCRASPDDHS